MLKQTGYSREAPLLPAILRFSIPLMLTGILQLAYNTADSIIVGRYAGHASLAAVGSTTSIIFLIITLFNGVSIGANYMAARDFGAQDDRGLFRTVHWRRLAERYSRTAGLRVRASALHPPAALGGRPGGRSVFVGAVSANLLLRRPRSGGLQLRQCSAAGGGRHLLPPAVHDRLRRAERRAESAVSGGHPSGCGRRGHCHLLSLSSSPRCW